MKATYHISVTIDLSDPDDYDDGVSSWEDAAAADYRLVAVASDIDTVVTLDSTELTGEEEWVRAMPPEESAP